MKELDRGVVGSLCPRPIPSDSGSGSPFVLILLQTYAPTPTNATTATTTALTYPAFPLPLSTPFTTPFAVLPFTPFALHSLPNRAFSAGVIRCSTGCTAAISVPRFRYAE